MSSHRLDNLIKLCNLKTAPFHEQNVIHFLEAKLAGLPHVSHRRDVHGNTIVSYRHRRESERPIVLTGHTDHPGFHVLRGGDAEIEVEFLGYVKDEYYPGSRAVFYPGEIRGVVGEMLTEPGKRPKRFRVEVEAEVPAGTFGMWELPDAAIRGEMAELPAADDLAGVAAILSALEEVAGAEQPADFHILFTRAEEIGFGGALGFCLEPSLPREAVMLAIETSRELPAVQIGAGPIIRVADRFSVFDDAATRLLVQVSGQLQKEDAAFRFQRALMDGGSCESTAYQQFGWTSAALCLALRNYHNMGSDNRIEPEAIALADYDWLVDLFKAAVTTELTLESARAAQVETLRKTYDTWGERLRNTAAEIDNN